MAIEGHLLFEHPSLYDEIVALCRRSGFSPKIVREAAPKQSIIALVSVGLGISLLPATLQTLRRPGVVYRPIRGPNLLIDTSVIYRRDDPSPVTSAFLDVVRKHVARETVDEERRAAG